MLKKSLVLFIVFSLFIANGCKTICNKTSNCPKQACTGQYKNSSASLLEGAELVGSGFVIEWKPKTSGTFYYTWNGKIISMSSSDGNQSFRCDYLNPAANKMVRINLAIPTETPIASELWFKPDPQPTK